ncbi:MAG: DegV family protein [Clostridia bacterium]|nr:DegV family protein [Clostridia bacterium]
MVIITDSAADMSREELAHWRVQCIPTGVIFGDDEYISSDELTEEELWRRSFAGERIRTSQPSPQAFLSVFESVKAAGETAIYIGISSALSGTLQSAKLALSMLDYDGIHIVDSLCGAAAQKLLVLFACRLRDEGRLLAAEAAARIASIRHRIRLYASLDTLDNLARSGRIPKAVAGIGSLARLKPLLEVTQEGRIALAGKAFGRHRAIESLAQRVASMRIDPDHPVIPLYSHARDNCLSLIRKLSERGVSVNEELLSAIGPAIAAHIGPDAYGVTFVEAE